ncbi:RIPK1 [Branchiostoma lanceolatum]|uniref:RIPK1 protein n=1 Tax=Branchiostoma lanceolatum TaxID=7740 RepID=A0A8J9Z997_BRALA|nr:RIPK1 [Branchiostoma lanceolatum]
MNGRRATLDVLKDALVGCKHQDVVDIIEGRDTIGGGRRRHHGDYGPYDSNVTDMRRVFLLIKEKLGVRWKDFARALDFDEPTIDVFSYKHRDPRDACMDMLEEWRQNKGRGATLNELKEALKNAGRMDVVDAIIEHEEEFKIKRPRGCAPRAAQMPRNPEQKRVFISYTVDPDTDPHRTPRQRDSHIALQRERVRALSDTLRHNGVDSVIDQYLEQNPPHIWTRWTEDEIHMADYVLMICTPNYLQCVTGRKDEEATSEYKVRFEGKVIYAKLADPKVHEKFLPVFFDEINRDNVPTVFQGGHFYGPIERNPRYGQDSFNQLFYKIVGSAPKEKLPPPVGNIPPGLVPVPRRT